MFVDVRGVIPPLCYEISESLLDVLSIILNSDINLKYSE